MVSAAGAAAAAEERAGINSSGSKQRNADRVVATAGCKVTVWLLW